MRIDSSYQNSSSSGSSYTVRKNETLEELFGTVMQGKSKSSIKKLLQSGAVTVDGKTVSRLDETLSVGQVVKIGKHDNSSFKMPDGLRIVWEDAWLIVAYKEAGLLTVGNASQKRETAEEYLNNYMNFKKKGDRIYVVHRIDRDTSGILLFAKTSRVRDILRTYWHDIVISRQYIAVVEGRPYPKSGTIDTWIDEDPQLMTMYVCRPQQGKRAITHYKTLETDSRYSLVELELETGRKNQIRTHMSYRGNPVAGDAKYGAETNPIGRMCLHARQIRFHHPITDKIMEFSSDIPSDFLTVFQHNQTEVK